MKPPSRIPISAAKAIADKFAQRQVILVTWDGDMTHVVTYGVNEDECDKAALGGNFVKKALGWPERLCADEPSRVRKLKSRIEELERALREGKL